VDLGDENISIYPGKFPNDLMHKLFFFGENHYFGTCFHQ